MTPPINSIHKYPVRPNNLTFICLPYNTLYLMAHFLAFFPKI